MFGCNAGEHCVAEKSVSALGKWRPGFRQNAQRCHDRQRILLLAKRIDFNLIHLRANSAGERHVHQTVRREIADAHGTQQIFAVKRLYRSPCTENIPDRLMNEIKIQIIEPQQFHGAKSGAASTGFRRIFHPELRGNKEFAPRKTAGFQSGADCRFIAVALSRVNGTVAGLERVFNGLLTDFRVFDLISAEHQSRHGDAVRECCRGYLEWSHFYCFRFKSDLNVWRAAIG